MWELFGVTALTIYAFATALWIVSVAVRDASIIDLFWGPFFVAAAWVLLAIGIDRAGARQLLFVFLVTAWGLRLAYHLTVRNLGHGEDRRYQLWRAHGGEHWWLKSYYRVYLLQATIALVVAAPIVACFASPHRISFVNWLGAIVCVAGIAFEATADIQLQRFRAQPDSAGRVMDHGLWYYSRHPNYFGDALMWWGLGLVAFSVDTWWSLIGPLAMTLVFLNVSQDVIERGLKKRRPDYERYIARTSAFVPRPPTAEVAHASPGKELQ
jgi:steroid 5-alpha reductase family enzyme